MASVKISIMRKENSLRPKNSGVSGTALAVKDEFHTAELMPTSIAAATG